MQLARLNITRMNAIHRGRRGVAMLLVIISLVMATILSVSYLASRDNSAAIGENVASAAAARWVAESGVQLATAILENPVDWRTTLTDGELLTAYPFGGGELTVTLIDLETKGFPTATTQYVEMTATAVVDGVEQTAKADVFVPLSADPPVDVDLSEFAIFAANSIELRNRATVTRWPSAPLTQLGKRVMLGTQASGAGSVLVADEAAAIDATVVHGPGASGLLVSLLSTVSSALELNGLLDTVPLPAARPHNESLPPPISLTTLTYNGGTGTTNADTRVNIIEAKNNAVRTLAGNITVITDSDLRINTGARVIINGNVKMVVFGDLKIDGGAIEVRPGSTLRLYARGSTLLGGIDINDGYIGPLRTVLTRDNSGRAPYFDPERIVIYSTTPALTSVQWQVRGNSVITGSMYVPDASRVLIEDTSALYGRVASTAVELRDDAALFYDPSLNSRTGYSTPSSALFNAGGNIRAPFLSLASLATGTMQACATTAATTIRGVTKFESDHVGGTPISPGVVAPTDPTPRTIPVEVEVESFGNSVAMWEG